MFFIFWTLFSLVTKLFHSTKPTKLLDKTTLSDGFLLGSNRNFSDEES